jgi:uncharacterized membrane protein
MKTNLWTEIKIIAIALIPIVYLTNLWNSLPVKIPLHWNIEGNVDGWGNKTQLLFLILFINIIAYFVLFFAPRIDPKNRIKIIEKKYQSIRFIVTIGMSFISMYIIYSSANRMVNINIVYIFIGILIGVLGNYFQVLPSNYFIGIKTPWTIENETVWKKTHQLAGKMWVVGGLMIVIFNFLVPIAIYRLVFFVILAIIVIVPIIYSYMIFNKVDK